VCNFVSFYRLSNIVIYTLTVRWFLNPSKRWYLPDFRLLRVSLIHPFHLKVFAKTVFSKDVPSKDVPSKGIFSTALPYKGWSTWRGCLSVSYLSDCKCTLIQLVLRLSVRPHPRNTRMTWYIWKIFRNRKCLLACIVSVNELYITMVGKALSSLMVVWSNVRFSRQNWWTRCWLTPMITSPLFGEQLAVFLG
jgi:hypothetical protein